MDSTEANICRLCFSTQRNLIDIFDASNSNIVEILREHIGEVSRLDALPKCICHNCWAKIDDFHKFHRSVHEAQKEYLKQIVKYEDENETEIQPHDVIEQPNFVEVITNCDDFNEFADENSTKPDVFNEMDEPQTKIEAPDELSDLATTETNEIDQGSEQEHRSVSGSNSDSDSNSDSGSDEHELMGSDLVDVDLAKNREIFAQHFDTTCDLCSIDMKNLRRAISHYKYKHRVDDGYIKCCGLKLKSIKLVNDHIKWHINPDIFKCKYCDRIMKTKLSLATHVANHRHSKTLICDICGKTFTQMNKLKIHMFGHTTASTCHICHKSCSSKEKLEAHLKFYHKPDEVKKQLNALREMKKTVLEASEIERVVSSQFDMKCDYCDGIFKSLQEAQYHYMHEHQIADGYIQCCGLKFKKTINIEGHVLWHLKPELFKCFICKKETITVIALRAHLRVHESRQLPERNTCKICNKTFMTKHHMNRHMKVSHEIDVTKKKSTSASHPDSNSTQHLLSLFDMRCEICKFELSSLHHAKLHYLTEHDIPDGYIRCCEMKFREVKNINDHLQYHMNPNIFKCNSCMKIFPRKADLSAHMSQHKAVDTKKFSCNECGKAWKSKYRLEIHKRTHEEKTAKTFPCLHCNRKFATEKLQKSHIFRIHEADKEAKTEICEYCAKTFTTRKEVLAHIRGMHTENSIRRERAQCQICKAWLSNRYTLKEHLIRHNSEPQKCNQCDKISPNQHALLCHIREVHCDRIFECHLCSKTFKAAIALKDHVATHTGNRTYKCSFCPETFIWRPNMYSHQKKAHPEEWKKKKTEVRRRTCK